jgi:tRNA (guanine37-N1)-methyltransferase
VPTATCLKVPKPLGEQAIRLAVEFELFNRNLQITQTGNMLLIPLTDRPSAEVHENLSQKLSTLEIVVCDVAKRPNKPVTHLDILSEQLPSNLIGSVPRAIDFVGDLAIVEIPDTLSAYKTKIGQAILQSHKPTVAVLAKSGAVEGVYRIRDLEVIAGENKTATLYKEYDCQYHVDVAKAYFSPRLSSEHNRVALSVKDGETVVDLFAGVGPFAIPIAKKHKTAKVYAIDINPDAVALLKRNIALNRAEQQVVPIVGDARLVVKEKLRGLADHVIMNLPETALAFVDVACEAIRPEGGVVHFYCFVKDSEPLQTAKAQLTEAVNQNNRAIKNFILAKTVREVAPYTWQVVVDAEIQ